MSQQLELELGGLEFLLNTQQLGLSAGGLSEEHAVQPRLEMVAGSQEEMSLWGLRLQAASPSGDQEDKQADWYQETGSHFELNFTLFTFILSPCLKH